MLLGDCHEHDRQRQTATARRQLDSWLSLGEPPPVPPAEELLKYSLANMSPGAGMALTSLPARPDELDDLFDKGGINWASILLELCTATSIHREGFPSNGNAIPLHRRAQSPFPFSHLAGGPSAAGALLLTVIGNWPDATPVPLEARLDTGSDETLLFPRRRPCDLKASI